MGGPHLGLSTQESLFLTYIHGHGLLIQEYARDYIELNDEPPMSNYKGSLVKANISAHTQTP